MIAPSQKWTTNTPASLHLWLGFSCDLEGIRVACLVERRPRENLRRRSVPPANSTFTIDFDDAGFGWHLFELATSLYFITGDSIYPTAREALIRGYRSERALPDDALGRLPLFLAARGTTYLGWVHTRQGSDTARELTPFLIERACAVAEEFLAAH